MLNAGDTAFIIICTALVMIMTPGLGFFYGGLGRRKNVVNNMMASIGVMGLGIVLWMVLGYSMAFGGEGFVIGSWSFEHIGHSGVAMADLLDPEAEGGSIPILVFSAFQMMFALITPAIITGSIGGRMKYKSLFIFLGLWSIIVYYPLAHMVWGSGGLLGGGWLGSLDFAGGNVVHISSGVSGLVLCLLLGKRRGYNNINYRVHNIPFVMIGMALLWFGWFGFNAGSALAAGELAGHAFMTTAVSAAAAMVSWMLIDTIKQGKPTLIGACTGVIAGLVGITPGAGFVPIYASLIIGLVVSPVCYFGITLVKKTLKIDDALDAFGCHGIGGIFGGIMTGVFAQAAIGGADGLVYGNPEQLLKQVIAILISIGVAVVGTLVCYAITRAFGPIRVAEKDESIGLDLTQHGEHAYPSFNGLD
ncbi:MAG: ammonium transporter [Clostridiales Family XIII bacterium]|jgi:Amt family ammonium transporter|nr:ammonium transporter [Clostridiales Family XIII bacterium]